MQFISSYQYENEFGISLSPIGEAAILIMEAAIFDGGTGNTVHCDALQIDRVQPA